jgi:hypothetical protein
MDDDGVRSFDEQALRASLALELLLKAALARLLGALRAKTGCNTQGAASPSDKSMSGLRELCAKRLSREK